MSLQQFDDPQVPYQPPLSWQSRCIWTAAAVLLLSLLAAGCAPAVVDLPSAPPRMPPPSAFTFEVTFPDVPTFGGQVVVVFESETSWGCASLRRVVVRELGQLGLRFSAGDCFAVRDLEVPR